MGRRFSIDEQVNALRPSVSSGLARHFGAGLLGTAAVLAMVALVMWHPVPLMLGLFLGVVGLSARDSGPRLEVAVRAYDEREPTRAAATVTVEPGDMDDRYFATVREADHPAMTYEFIPQRWTPMAGEHTVSVWRSATGELVLAATEDGLMIPRSRPVRGERDTG